ncbi:hypothetical protein [Methanobrevibacter sp.]|uniref:hypothetical protein n=1 Tax=Methanobrevibacter sp. TaxID=66852 RepID=UPI00388DB55B
MNQVVRENIEVTDENKEIYDMQVKITDIYNFILTYLDIYSVPNTLKTNLMDIIDNDGDVKQDLNLKEKFISYSMKFVMNLYKKERVFFKNWGILW